MNSPITGKTMSYSSVLSDAVYKGMEVSYIHIHWKCIDSGETFTTTEMDEINLNRIKEEWEKSQH